MSLLDKINKDMVSAMKAKEKEKLVTIRMIKASIQNEQIKLGHDLEESDELAVLSREAKQRRESIKEFEKADRADLVEKIKKELLIVEQYLPKQLTEEEVSKIISDTATELNISDMKQMGRLMGAIMPKLKGKADGNIVNKLVKEYLNR